MVTHTQILRRMFFFIPTMYVGIEIFTFRYTMGNEDLFRHFYYTNRFFLGILTKLPQPFGHSSLVALCPIQPELTPIHGQSPMALV